MTPEHRLPGDLLVLHAVRILGFADTAAVADRFDLDATETDTALRDAEANGWRPTPPSATPEDGR